MTPCAELAPSWSILTPLCPQILSCVVDLAAVFVEDLRDLAHIIDLTADIFTCSVAGCMGAQVRLRRECDPRRRVASGFTLWWGALIHSARAARPAPARAREPGVRWRWTLPTDIGSMSLPPVGRHGRPSPPARTRLGFGLPPHGTALLPQPHPLTPPLGSRR